MSDMQLRVLVMKDADAWVAQCLEYDIGAQANSLDALRQRFALTLKVEMEESIRRTGKPFGGLSPAPDYLQAMWKPGAEHFTLTSTAPAGSNSPQVGYEMTLLAA